MRWILSPIFIGQPEALKIICDETEGCVGFNTHGWLKKACPASEYQASVNLYLDSSSRFGSPFSCSLHSHRKGARYSAVADADGLPQWRRDYHDRPHQPAFPYEHRERGAA